MTWEIRLYTVLSVILIIKLQICENQKLALYTFDEQKKSVNSKILCNVVRVETGHVNNIAMILSKHNPFTGVFNFQ